MDFCLKRYHSRSSSLQIYVSQRWYVSIFFQYNNNFITVSGKTYPHRDTIKSLGGLFNGSRKIWQLPFTDSNLQAIERLCLRSGGGNLSREPLPIESDKEVTESGQIPYPAEPGISVGALMDRISASIASEFREPIWIIGEIHNMGHKKSAAYFYLSEPTGNSQGSISIAATIWSHQLELMKKKHGTKLLNEVLCDGLKVRFLCQVQLYKGRGHISLVVHDCDPTYTKGQQALEREQLLKELRESGLHIANKNLLPPRLPLRVGLITAQGSRAFGDFTHQLAEGGFCGKVIFFPSAMQGPATVLEVKAGIEELSAHNCDVIVITRGGGSSADLRWFDAKEIAYAIARSPIPIIAAIGHHDDHCVAEEICFLHRKTPTAAADFIIEAFMDLRQQLVRYRDFFAQQISNAANKEEQRFIELSKFWQQAVQSFLEKCTVQLTILSSQLEQKSLVRLINYKQYLIKLANDLFSANAKSIYLSENKVNQLLNHLQLAIVKNLSESSHLINQWEKTLIANDPKPWLVKGWTQLRGAKGLISSIQEVEQGDNLWARFIDGELQLSVTNKKES